MYATPATITANTTPTPSAGSSRFFSDERCDSSSSFLSGEGIPEVLSS
jgi:hypothetical protein